MHKYFIAKIILNNELIEREFDTYIEAVSFINLYDSASVQEAKISRVIEDGEYKEINFDFRIVK